MIFDIVSFVLSSPGRVGLNRIGKKFLNPYKVSICDCEQQHKQLKITENFTEIKFEPQFKKGDFMCLTFEKLNVNKAQNQSTSSAIMMAWEDIKKTTSGSRHLKCDLNKMNSFDYNVTYKICESKLARLVYEVIQPRSF